MTDSSTSENSACTWHLGVEIDDPDDVRAFEEHMQNPFVDRGIWDNLKQSSPTWKFSRDAIDLHRRGVV